MFPPRRRRCRLPPWGAPACSGDAAGRVSGGRRPPGGQRVDQLLMLLNLLLLGFVSFVPLPTRLVAEHTAGADARTAMRLYGGTVAGCALAFNLIWFHAARASLLAAA